MSLLLLPIVIPFTVSSLLKLELIAIYKVFDWLTVFIIASLFAGYGDVPVWLTCNGELVADCGDFELDSASSFRVIYTTELWNIFLTLLVNIHVTCWSKEKIAFTQTIKLISYINSKFIFFNIWILSTTLQG